MTKFVLLAQHCAAYNMLSSPQSIEHQKECCSNGSCVHETSRACERAIVSICAAFISWKLCQSKFTGFSRRYQAKTCFYFATSQSAVFTCHNHILILDRLRFWTKGANCWWWLYVWAAKCCSIKFKNFSRVRTFVST